RFPHLHPELHVYMQVTGHPATARGTVLFRQGSTDRVLRRRALPPVEFLGPLEMIPVYLRIDNCEFPEPGLYYFQIVFDGQLRAERFLEVIDATESES